MKGPRPKIAFVAHRVGADGGIENIVLNLVEHCLGRGDEVAVLADSLPPQLQGRVRFERAAIPKGLPWALRLLAFAFSSRAAARRLGPGWVLHANAPTFAPAHVALAHSVHAVGSHRVLAAEPSRLRRAWYLLRTLAPLTDWLSGANWRDPALKVPVASSHGVAAELASLYPLVRGRVRVVPNGFDPKRFIPLAPGPRKALRSGLGLAPGDLALLFVGKDFHRKGLEPALRALALLPPKVKLLIAGENADVVPTAHFKALAAELGLGGRARFLGHQKDVAPWFQACDALVFPTLYESFAVVSAEAMGAGLPLLASHANGIDDLLVQGVNGAFIERSGASIAAAVRRHILPASRRLRLRRGALAAAAGLGWAKVAARHRAVCLQAGSLHVR